MTRHEEDIRDYPLTAKYQVQTGIQYSQRFEEWEACIAAHLDVWKWEYTAVYSQQFKAKVIAWYGLHCLIEAHSEDARARKQEEESKRKS